MKLVIPSLVIICLLILSCKEDEPTAPEEETPNENEILVEATVGPEGGALETEDFKLSIPSGAFDQNEDLKLFIYENDSTPENLSSAEYMIEGIPKYFNESLDLAIKYNGELNGLILVKREMETELSNTDTSLTMMEIELFEITEDDGFILTQFPALEASDTIIPSGELVFMMDAVILPLIISLCGVIFMISIQILNIVVF